MKIDLEIRPIQFALNGLKLKSVEIDKFILAETTPDDKKRSKTTKKERIKTEKGGRDD